MAFTSSSTNQERGTLRSGIMMATRNPAGVGNVAKSRHAPSAILAPHFLKMGIAKSETGSGKDRASARRLASEMRRISEPMTGEDERIQPVGESTRSCILIKEACMRRFRLTKHQVKCLEAYATATQVSREEYLAHLKTRMNRSLPDEDEPQIPEPGRR